MRRVLAADRAIESIPVPRFRFFSPGAVFFCLPGSFCDNRSRRFDRDRLLVKTSSVFRLFLVLDYVI